MIRNIKKEAGSLASLKSQLADSKKTRGELLHQRAATQKPIREQLDIIKDSGADCETLAVVEQINSMARSEIRKLDNLNLKLSQQIKYFDKKITLLVSEAARVDLAIHGNISRLI